MSSGVWLAVECGVFAAFVCATTCAPLWRRGAKPAPGAGKSAYVFGDGGVSSLAMVLSVSRGTIGVRSFLGYPAELIYRGSAMWETLYGMVIAFPLVTWILVPLYWRLRTTSVYEYLQMRFGGVGVRRLAAATFLLRQLLILAVTVYTPCVALSAVLPLPHAATAAVMATLSIVFTLLGGLRAAIRADAIQTLVMVVVSVAFIAQATWRAGGPAAVLRANIDGGRMVFLQSNGDPRTRVDTASALLGQLFMSLSIYGCQQTFVQRYVSMPSLERARRTLLSAVPAVALLFSMSWVVGMALYAVYQTCDPYAAGRISNTDEILSYYVENQFGFLPGMMGLFLGSLFNGALSLLVSNVNSLSTVTWEDFVSAAPSFHGISDQQQLKVIKIIGIIYCVAISAMSLGVGAVGGVVEGSMLVTSATSGALLGGFVLAVFCPLADARAALCGMISAHGLTLAMAVGRLLVVRRTDAPLPLRTDGCSNGTIVGVEASTTPAEVAHALMHLAPLLGDRPTTPAPPVSTALTMLLNICEVSYMWYAVIGTLVCVLVGNFVGVVLPASDTLEARLLHPAAAALARRFPILGGRRLRWPEDEKRPPTPSPPHSPTTPPSPVPPTHTITQRPTTPPSPVPPIHTITQQPTSPNCVTKTTSPDTATLDIEALATANRLFDAYSPSSHTRL